MWTASPPKQHLKRHQDLDDSSDAADKVIFLEKRQGKKRKKRKLKENEPSLSHNLAPRGLLRDVPAVTRSRLTQRLGSVLGSSGQIGNIATRLVRQDLDEKLARSKPDISSLQGPPSYRRLPRPMLYKEKSTAFKENVRPVQYKEKTRLNTVTVQSGRKYMVPKMFDHDSTALDMMLQQTISEKWPGLDYEEKLQEILTEKIRARMLKRELENQIEDTPPRQTSSNSSSSNLTKPFSNWSLQDNDQEMVDFETSFCQTVKRSFSKHPTYSDQHPEHHYPASRGSSGYPNPSHHQQNALSLFEDERDSLSSLDMTCNALTILQNQAENESSVYQMNSRHPYPTSEYDLKPPGPPSELFWEKNNFQLEYDSGNGSCDLLDSIHDTYKSAHKLGKTKRKPSREHSGLYGPYHIPDKERDFLDVMDSMHRPVSPLEPRSSQNSGKSKKKKLLDSYINKQFYQQKQWLK